MVETSWRTPRFETIELAAQGEQFGDGRHCGQASIGGEAVVQHERTRDIRVVERDGVKDVGLAHADRHQNKGIKGVESADRDQGVEKMHRGFRTPRHGEHQPAGHDIAGKL